MPLDQLLTDAALNVLPTGVTLGQLTNFLVKQRTDGWQVR